MNKIGEAILYGVVFEHLLLMDNAIAVAAVIVITR